MNTMVLVVAVILNWNNAPDTVACLGALQRLKNDGLEILVMDNGSTDDSVQAIRSAFPQVEILENGANLGFGGGNNPGIRLALERGADWVWLLNNDAVVDDRTLPALLETGREPRVGAVGSVLIQHDGTGRIQAWGGGRLHRVRGVVRYGVGPRDRIDYLTGASLLVRAAAFRTVGLLDPDYFLYWEDVDFSLRLQEAGFRLAVAPDSRVAHRESTTLGRGSARLDYFLTASGTRFFRRHARFPLLPIALGFGGRLMKRVVTGRFRHARAVLQGIAIGWSGQDILEGSKDIGS